MITWWPASASSRGAEGTSFQAKYALMNRCRLSRAGTVEDEFTRAVTRVMEG
jgi:hypothetical protein